MTNGTFEQYLVDADGAVQQGDWQGAIQALQQADALQPQQAPILTALGTCHIQLGQMETAVDYFQMVAGLAPEVFEVHNNLGVALTLASQYAGAEKAFRRALEIDGDNLAAWKNLAQACLQQNDRVSEGVQILASAVKSHPEDCGALVMMANVYEDAGELDSAELLFQQALKNEPGLKDAIEGVDRVAQARARLSRIARPEHAKKLAALKGLKKAAAGEAAVPELQPVGPFSGAIKKVVFYALENTQGFFQAGLLKRSLVGAGRQARVSSRFDLADLTGADLLVFSQPNLSGEFIAGINACIQKGRPFAVAIDQDFHHIPQDHPAYYQFGPGNPASLKALEVVMGEAQFVMVPTSLLAERMRPYARKVEVVPPALDRENPQWSRPKMKHTGFHIGWIGSAADREDLLSIKKALLSFMRATPEAVLVVAGDEGALAKFGAIDERRRLFLPAAGPEEIPYVLGQFDVLIVPMRDNPFNQAKSALPLMEAEARGVPWVASPMPAFREWGKGGVLAETMQEWGAGLKKWVKIQ